MADSSSTFTRASAGYERVMVPAVFGPWAKDLLDTAGVASGMRVLDVACGTGIVARLAAPQVGPTGRVVGLDSNEAMLAVARAQPMPMGAQVEWRHGDTTKLPFPDEQFDSVLCQHGLQYVPDRTAALREMKRVLATGGRLALSVFSQSIGYQIFEQTAAKFVGEQAAAIMREPFALNNLDELSGLLRMMELSAMEMHTKTLPARFPSASDFIEYQLGGRLANAVSTLSDEIRTALVAALRKAFEPYVGPDGLAFPMEAHVVLARR
ncbi:MAG TPA: methyltransferase domain-containing protein [Candidatus Binatia bacterium]|jgi:ubiquinone/menaquinone biosynthesis C-methylase UbiE